MSLNRPSIFRHNQSADLQKLAEDHFKHDLNEKDRDIVKSASSTLSTHATIGTVIGLGLGIAAAWRIRSTRVQLFNAYKAARKPTHVKFADGTEEAIPDMTSFVQPTRLGDFATYTFAGFFGLFLGGELGVLTGAYSAKNTLTRDPDTDARIRKAMRGFQADVLRKQLQAVESGNDNGFSGFGM